MKISQVVQSLEDVQVEHGDITVLTEIDCHGGDYGGYNSTKIGRVEYLNVNKGNCVLSGGEAE